MSGLGEGAKTLRIEKLTSKSYMKGARLKGPYTEPWTGRGKRKNAS